MAIKSIFSRYQKSVETKENHHDEQLRTRYYKASFNQLFQSAEDLLRADPAIEITSVSKEHGEIAAEIKGSVPAFLIMTIVTVKPYQTAVDFHLSTEKLVLTGARPALRSEAVRLYTKLDKAHSFIGAGKSGE